MEKRKEKSELEKNVELLRQDVDELADLIRRLVDIVEKNTDTICTMQKGDSYFRVDSKGLHFN